MREREQERESKRDIERERENLLARSRPLYLSQTTERPIMDPKRERVCVRDRERERASE
jgi:hypothetical protein